MWEVYVIMFMVVIVLSILWVKCIINTHEKYPDYKGNQDGFDFDDEIKDWDVTVADGLDEEQDDIVKRFYEQMEKEVHQNRGNLNK